MASVEVHYLPQFVAESDLADATVVVVDLVRASTTICQALASGATDFLACLEVDDVARQAEGLDREGVVLGGERGGEIIPGFDLGNSPAEYTPDEVYGRRVLFTTTNGTRAIEHARLASRLLIGAAVNRAALVENLVQNLTRSPRVCVLCAGTAGVVSREDILGAGAIVSRLADAGAELANEWAGAARGEWQELENTARSARRSVAEHFALELRNTPGGKNLLRIGMDDDLARCAAIDTLDVVPERAPGGAIRLP